MTATVFYDTYSTGMSRSVEDAPEELPCAMCKGMKPVSEFPLATSRDKQYYWSYCKDCRNKDVRDRRQADPDGYHARDRAYYQANREHILQLGKKYRTPEVQRARNLRAYGLTPEGYRQLLELQEHACAICGSSRPGGRSPNFHVDHDHQTGAVRGLLCQACNLALGAFRDNADILRAAIAYLERGDA